MAATFDATTTAEYEAATTAAERSAVIVAALTGTISVKVFNGSNVEMGSGTMTAPWATASNNIVTVGEVSSFTVGTTATPDANWYIRFQNAGVTRWVRGSFGLSGSGQNFTWSLSTWTATHTGTIGVATINTSGNSAPVFTLAPTTASIAATGGTIQFTALDADSDVLIYSLTTTRSGITIDSATGTVSVTAAAAGTSGNIVVQVSDGILTASTTCLVSVASAVDGIHWHPGHGTRSSDDDEDSEANCIARGRLSIDWMDDSPYMADGFAVCMVRWGRMNTTGSTYDWTIPDNLLAYAKARGRRLVLMVMFKAFGQADSTNLIPADLRSAGYLATGQNSNGNDICIGEMWTSLVMNRFIAFLQIVANRYNDDPYFEGVTWPETATWPSNSGNNAAYLAQLQVLYPAAKTAFPNSNVFANMNSLSVSGSVIPTLMESAYQAGIGFACPDAREETGAMVFRGLSGAVRDYRGKMPCICIVSASTYEYAVAAQPSNPTSYIVDWLQNEGCTHHAYRKYTWWNAALTSIAADPAVSTSCPTVYGGTCSGI